MNELPKNVRDIIDEARPDINFIHWDEAYHEDALDEWVVPVEALFKAEDGFEPGECGWHHGNMRVEYRPDDPVAEHQLDHFVGDWTPGMHPDLHTFER